MSRVERTRIRQLLRQRQEALLSKTIDANGQVDSQELESLGRLEKLYGLSGSTTHTLLIEILIGGVVVLCVLSLLLLRVPKAGIELHAEATKVRFVLSGTTAVSGALPIRWVAVQGHRQIAVSSAGDEGVIKITDPLVTLQLA